MSEATGSQTVDTQEDKSAAIAEAYEAFGLEIEEEPDNAEEEQKEPPATEEPQEEPKKITVKPKYNKEIHELELTEDELTEYVEKGMALERERERKSEYQKYLDEVAKLQGYKDHEDLIANLDKIKEDAKKREEDQFKQLREDLRQQAEEAGLDPEKVEQFIDNHPLMKEAHKIKAESEERAKVEQQIKWRQDWDRKWDELYKAFPDIVDDAKAWERGESPSFYTHEMREMVEVHGYHPLHAYKLAHMDKITSTVKEQARQAEIKKQIYNKRSQVETETGADLEPEVPDQLKNAFSLFGLDPKRAKKYVKAK